MRILGKQVVWLDKIAQAGNAAVLSQIGIVYSPDTPRSTPTETESCRHKSVLIGAVLLGAALLGGRADLTQHFMKFWGMNGLFQVSVHPRSHAATAVHARGHGNDRRRIA